MPQNYKVGDKVRILNASKIISGVSRGIKDGDIYEVVELYRGREYDPIIKLDDGLIFGFMDGDYNYIEKVAEDVTKFKVGDKVKAVTDKYRYTTESNGWQGVVTKVWGGSFNAKTTEGRSQDIDYVFTGLRVSEFEKVSEKSTKNQRISTLESEVAELKAKVEALEKAQSKPKLAVGDYVKLIKSDRGNEGNYAKIIEVGTFEASTPRGIEGCTYKVRMLSGKEAGAIFGGRDEYYVKVTQREVEQSLKPKTSNEQRKAIIAEAKAFVEDVTNRNHPDLVSQGLTIGAWFVSRGAAVQTIKAEFIINADKRTVVALIRDIRGNRKNKVRAKAIAKCAPDDVFNADIGKAIALGRALGLDVKRFEQAVKPTEVVVGHRVHKFRSVCHIADGTVVSVGDTSYVQGNEGCKFTSGDKSEWSFKDWVTITDDSEAQY